MRQEITKTFEKVFVEQDNGAPMPCLNDDLILLESGLDSFGFAILVTELEETLGFDPFTLSEEAYYPQTYGEFVAFYEKYKPQ